MNFLSFFVILSIYNIKNEENGLNPLIFHRGVFLMLLDILSIGSDFQILTIVSNIILLLGNIIS